MTDTKKHPLGIRAFMETFDVSWGVAITAFSIGALIVLVGLWYFIHSAPPSSITISTGPEGSMFQKYAQRYAKILEANGVKMKILTSKGSPENLDRLTNPKSHVDVAIIQGGITNDSMDDLVSLGGITYQPVLIFHRGKPINLLSELTGKKISIGPIGSGTRKFALAILAANGIKEGGNTTLLDLEAQEAADDLLNKKIDAAFIMSESASGDILKKLMHSTVVNLYDFKQASAYTRKIDYLSKLILPQGSIDLGLNIPDKDISLVGPMVELVAVKDLHPALSDLLLEAATEVHGKPGIFQTRGEFPTPVEHAIKVSEDASRYYKSGKSLFYRYLPFWLASLTSRIVVVFIPMLVVLIPAMRAVPAFFRWRTMSAIRRRYRELLLLEKEFMREKSHIPEETLQKRFDRIDESVNKMKVKAAFADQFYALRGHIAYVRQLSERRQAQ